MGKERRRASYLILCLTIGLTGAVTFAQELTPRAYWPAPRGVKVATFAYQYSTGDILMDPSLPIVGVDSRINLTQFSYLQTINLAGRTAQVQLSAPYSWGTTEGVVDGVDRSRYIAGWADARARLSVNLLGAPTMEGLNSRSCAPTRDPLWVRVCSCRFRPVATSRTN